MNFTGIKHVQRHQEQVRSFVTVISERHQKYLNLTAPTGTGATQPLSQQNYIID